MIKQQNKTKQNKSKQKTQLFKVSGRCPERAQQMETRWSQLHWGHSPAPLSLPVTWAWGKLHSRQVWPKRQGSQSCQFPIPGEMGQQPSRPLQLQVTEPKSLVSAVTRWGIPLLPAAPTPRVQAPRGAWQSGNNGSLIILSPADTLGEGLGWRPGRGKLRG